MVIVVNSGKRISTNRELKPVYSTQEVNKLLKAYGKYLIRSLKKGWQDVHDFYCVYINEVINRSTEFKKYQEGNHLYLMQNEAGLIKIGRSSDVPKRVKDLRVQTGFQINIIHVFENQGNQERFWHKFFHMKNVRFIDQFGTKNKEWFNLDSVDISTIFNNYESKRKSGSLS